MARPVCADYNHDGPCSLQGLPGVNVVKRVWRQLLRFHRGLRPATEKQAAQTAKAGGGSLMG